MKHNQDTSQWDPVEGASMAITPAPGSCTNCICRNTLAQLQLDPELLLPLNLGQRAHVAVGGTQGGGTQAECNAQCPASLRTLQNSAFAELTSHL